MMALTLIPTRSNVRYTVPTLGVVPPSNRFWQSSTRAAPPCSAAMAEATESMQISRMGMSLMVSFAWPSVTGRLASAKAELFFVARAGAGVILRGC